jgi:hypothetical protein
MQALFYWWGVADLSRRPKTYKGLSIITVNPGLSISKNDVIPAQADIQMINKFPRKWGSIMFCPLRGAFL